MSQPAPFSDEWYADRMRQVGVEQLPVVGPLPGPSEERTRKALASLEANPAYQAALEQMRALRFG